MLTRIARALELMDNRLQGIEEMLSYLGDEWLIRLLGDGDSTDDSTK